jgi:hypothetical protein
VRPVGIVGAAALPDHGAAMPPEQPLANPRARKMMSRSAYLAAHCLHELVTEVGWDATTRERAGYYLGVGASGGSLADVTALLEASIVDHQFQAVAFGEHGLAACNPLLAFQLMNNFTLCHGAILEGIGGPNSALFSRGAGTVSALLEAVHALRESECDHAIAGGADSALHPVTQAELARDGFVGRGLVPAEGAGLVALSATSPGIATIEGVAVANGTQGSRAIDDAVARALDAEPNEIDLVVIAPWGPPAADALASWARVRQPTARVFDLSLARGDALAASPALAWIAALDLLVARQAKRALVVSLGTDGDIGVVVLRGAA